MLEPQTRVATHLTFERLRMNRVRRYIHCRFDKVNLKNGFWYRYVIFIPDATRAVHPQSLVIRIQPLLSCNAS